MNTDLFTKGNITTFATWAAIVLSFIFSYFGFQIDQGVLIAFICMIVTLIIALYSSKHPNNLEIFGNDQETVAVTVDASEVLERVQEFIDVLEQSKTSEEEVDDNELQ